MQSRLVHAGMRRTMRMHGDLHQPALPPSSLAPSSLPFPHSLSPRPGFLAQLLSHVVLGFVLSTIVPFWYGKRPKLMMLGSAPYSEILTAVKRDSMAALAIAASLAVWAVFAISKALLAQAKTMGLF